MLITRSDSQLGPIGTKRQRRDGRRVLGVELHSFLGVMVPNGNETVRTTGRKRIVSIPLVSCFWPRGEEELGRLTWGGRLEH